MLSQFTVLALEQAVAAPLTTRLLAMRGARVIKVERKGYGDFARKYDTFAQGSCSYFSWLNAGKESLEIDFNSDQDKLLLKQIIRKSKNIIVVSNQVPGTLWEKGLCPEQHLSQLNSSLISVQINGWGLDPLFAKRKAYDLIVAAEAGLCSVTGSEESGPSRVGISIVDIHTGRLAYQTVLEGLLQSALEPNNNNTNKKHFHLSMFDSTAELMTVPLLQLLGTGKAPVRSGLKHPSIAPYGSFKCGKDNKSILLSIQNEQEWKQLLVALHLTKLLGEDQRFQTNTLRVQHRTILDNILQQKFDNKTSKDALSLLQQHNIACSLLSRVEDLAQHPLLRTYEITNELGNIVKLPCEAGFLLDGNIYQVPRLGQHNELIRKEFG
jgi:crotonobetainyl-CoA:carnitine CoA-transferase CaiB-like acyl-CoA transferase